ncbi:hypothetical protein OSB04_007148 [Centaurea solstitialis]|uniref:Ribosomal protein L34Ae n=1 Tax=Centaurea solstitialis TaxID=347529 RepID=A0AA38TJA9_9ASTR|nr:hypothetical protein OSB04_007148 [Centaurea solstitialis]
MDTKPRRTKVVGQKKPSRKKVAGDKTQKNEDRRRRNPEEQRSPETKPGRNKFFWRRNPEEISLLKKKSRRKKFAGDETRKNEGRRRRNPEERRSPETQPKRMKVVGDETRKKYGGGQRWWRRNLKAVVAETDEKIGLKRRYGEGDDQEFFEVSCKFRSFDGIPDGFEDGFGEKEGPHEGLNEKVDLKVDEHKFNQESVYSYVNSHADSISSNNVHLSISNPVDAYGDDDDFKDDFEEKEAPLEGSHEKVDLKVNELHKFHQESVYSHVNSHTDSFTSNNFLSSISNPVDEYDDEFGRKSNNKKESVEKTADSNNKNLSNDSRNKLEASKEHQGLIEQLKMEIKKAEVIGLPTIFEESESSPKMKELQPLKKIEEAYQHKMNEVHKFYEIYKERMRKFDIFSYQKMYATGPAPTTQKLVFRPCFPEPPSIRFLQLNDPFQSVSSSRSLVPEITTHLCRSFSSIKVRKREKDPTTKFIKELQSDLEVVYVGQMCLAWEILHWQYKKVLEIWELDPRGVHQFHEVSCEFQRFLVMMQRFLEEEPFHSPRVQNYIKTRCVFRDLLQVPLIREDDQKNRRKIESQADRNGMSCDMLVEILEESIRLFWRFVYADKDTRKTPLEFQKPEDSRLFMEVQKDLQKVMSNLH